MPRTRDEAYNAGLKGWNLRCSFCGDYGAQWVESGTHGYGGLHGRGYLPLCPDHAAQWREEMRRHEESLHRLSRIHFEQAERVVVF